MAINTQAQAGVQITSSAKNGTLGAQGVINNDQVVLPDAITTGNNGNLMAAPTYVGRLIMLRKGTATQEVRYILTDVANTLTVHENWQVPPTSGDAYDISYIIQDAATVTGLTLVNKRVADYASTRRFQILTGGWFAMMDGVSLETNDNGSTTEADFIVNSGGIFDNGYLASGTPVSGGYIIGTPATSGELVFNAIAGSECRINDWFLTCVQQNQTWINGSVELNKAKIFSGSYTMDLTGGITDTVSLKNITIEGKSTTNDTIEVNQYTEIDNAVIIATNGFITTDNATTETIELRNVLMLPNNLRLILVNNDKTWKFVNPDWIVDITSQNDISFENGTNNQVQELFTLNVDVQTPAGVGIESAEVYLYEGAVNQNLPTAQQQTTSVKADIVTIEAGGTGYVVDDVLTVTGGTSVTATTFTVTSVSGGVITGIQINEVGDYTVIPTNPVAVTGGTGNNDATFNLQWAPLTNTSDVLKRTFNDNAGVSLTTVTYDDFALKVYKYGKFPFVGSVDMSDQRTITVGLATDEAITELSQSTAITNGSGITVERHASGETDIRPTKAIAYDNGTTPFVVGTIVTGATSGASGTIADIVGSTSDGTILVELWNGTEFVDNENLQVAAVTFATSDTATFYEEYTWVVDGNGLSLTTIYDYLAARMAEVTLIAPFEAVIVWGEDEQTQLLYSGTSGFTTERNENNAEGVWIANAGSGLISYLTSNSGTRFIPPVQYSFTLTGLATDSEVRLFTDDSLRTEVAGTESSGTSFTYNYIYSGDINVYVVVFHLQFREVRIAGLTLSNASQSIPIQQQTDRVFLNP